MWSLRLLNCIIWHRHDIYNDNIRSLTLIDMINKYFAAQCCGEKLRSLYLVMLYLVTLYLVMLYLVMLYLEDQLR